MSVLKRATTSGTANATTLVLTIPATTQVGDDMTLAWYSQSGYTLTNPAGWTQWDDGVNGNEAYRILRRTAQAGDAGSTVTLTTATANKMSAALGVAYGVDGTTPLNATETPAENAVNVSGTSWANPSATLSAAAFVWAFFGLRASTVAQTAITKPSAWTQDETALQGISGDTCAALAHQAAAAGSVGGDNWTTSQTAARAVMHLIVLNAANTAPTADAGPDQSGTGVVTGATITLDGSGSGDPDGDPITYAWSWSSRPAGSTAAFSSSTAAGPTFVPDLAGTYVASLTVTDSHSAASSPDTVTITVTSSNVAPTADAGPDQVDIEPGTTVTLDGSGSYDPDAGDTLTYAWTPVSGPTVTLSDPTAMSPTYEAPATLTGGPIVHQLVVTDNHGSASTPASVSKTILPASFHLKTVGGVVGAVAFGKRP